MNGAPVSKKMLTGSNLNSHCGGVAEPALEPEGQLKQSWLCVDYHQARHPTPEVSYYY